MTHVPILTDRQALRHHRWRARQRPDHAGAMFLHQTAILDVQERLIEVNRTFTQPAVVTGFPELWQDLMPEAKVINDDDGLALEPEAHDLVIHAMSLHWANDPLGHLVQCRRALRPDGLFLGSLLGGRTLHELRTSMAEAESAVVGGLSPRVLPMAEIRDLGGLLQRAGFALPVADSYVQTVSYRSVFELMADLRAMGETSALAGRPRHFTRRAVVTEAAGIYARTYPGDDGRILATFDRICLTGWAPHEGQQTPLRPGSAKRRLADALSVPEQPLPDGS
jgi:SAM-dependent methyltransferase